jgi:hypothetical protein
MPQMRGVQIWEQVTSKLGVTVEIRRLRVLTPKPGFRVRRIFVDSHRQVSRISVTRSIFETERLRQQNPTSEMAR